MSIKPDNIHPDPSAESYYKRLDVPKDATERSIRTAWKIASSQYHPDSSTSSSSQTAYIRLQKARDVLQNSEERAIYDRISTSCGYGIGTHLYEKWVSKGEPEPLSDWIEKQTDFELDSSLESDGPSNTSQSPSNRLEGSDDRVVVSGILTPTQCDQVAQWSGSPSVSSSNSDNNMVSVSRSPQDDMRIYISSVLFDQIVLDLASGRLEGGDCVENVSVQINVSKQTLFISDGDSIDLCIDFSRSDLDADDVDSNSQQHGLANKLKSYFPVSLVFSPLGGSAARMYASFISLISLPTEFFDLLSDTPIGKLLHWDFPPQLSLRVPLILFLLLFANPTDLDPTLSIPILALAVFFPRLGLWLTSIGSMLFFVLGGEYIFAALMYGLTFILSYIYHHSTVGTKYAIVR